MYLLEQCGLARYAPAFRNDDVDDSCLGTLTPEDLHDLGLPMGPRVRLARAIRERNAAAASVAPSLPPPPPLPPPMRAAAAAARGDDGDDDDLCQMCWITPSTNANTARRPSSAAHALQTGGGRALPRRRAELSDVPPARGGAASKSWT